MGLVSYFRFFRAGWVLAREGAFSNHLQTHGHQIFQPENRVAILPEKAVCLTLENPAAASMESKRAGSGNLRMDSTRY